MNDLPGDDEEVSELADFHEGEWFGAKFICDDVIHVSELPINPCCGLRRGHAPGCGGGHYLRPDRFNDTYGIPDPAVIDRLFKSKADFFRFPIGAPRVGKYARLQAMLEELIFNGSAPKLLIFDEADMIDETELEKIWKKMATTGTAIVRIEGI